MSQLFNFMQSTIYSSIRRPVYEWANCCHMVWSDTAATANKVDTSLQPLLARRCVCLGRNCSFENPLVIDHGSRMGINANKPVPVCVDHTKTGVHKAHVGMHDADERHILTV